MRFLNWIVEKIEILTDFLEDLATAIDDAMDLES